MLMGTVASVLFPKSSKEMLPNCIPTGKQLDRFLYRERPSKMLEVNLFFSNFRNYMMADCVLVISTLMVRASKRIKLTNCNHFLFLLQLEKRNALLPV